MFGLFKKKTPKPPEGVPPSGPAPAGGVQEAVSTPVNPQNGARAQVAAPSPPPQIAQGNTDPAVVPITLDMPVSAFFNRLKVGLRNTGSKLSTVLTGRRIDETLFNELEDALISADTGVETAATLIESLRERARKNKLETAEQLRDALHQLLVDMLRPLEQPEVTEAEGANGAALPKPFIIMLAGVNGAGKTTSIGKLAKRFQAQGLSVMLAAGDTFRAAAREQLAAWGERNNVAVISQSGGDPAAVIFDAAQAARARGIDVLLADTAGRLPTQLHLMEEVKKIKRVIAKADPDAPHAVWLVLDANTGQNALNQLKAFDAAIGVTGVILTKLDGTAKGGVVAAIANAHRDSAAKAGAAKNAAIPGLALAYVGVGESIDDLRPFDAEQFVSALLGES